MSEASGGDRPATDQPAESTVGSVVGALIERELMRERERATELVERALKLVTAVGALVTLIFAFVALVPKEQLGVSAQTFGWLVAALASFVASGALYLLPLGTPLYTRRLLRRGFRRWLPPPHKALVTIKDTEPSYLDAKSWVSWAAHWNEPAGKALPAAGAPKATSQMIAEARAHALDDLRTRNKYLLRVIGFAVFLDVLGLGLLALAITQALRSPSG